MLRLILVALDGSEHNEGAVTLAIEWALQFGARLVGVGVLDMPTITKAEPLPSGATAYKKARDEARLLDAHDQLRRFLGLFEQRCAESRVPSKVIEAVGDPAQQIQREAQRCDLVMLGRETHFRFETQDQADATLAHVLRGSPRPIVTVPRERSAGQGVMVAYGGGQEVARTLQTFQLLGLAAGETVHLVSFHREGWEAAELATLAADFLAAHGTSYQLHALIQDKAPAKILLDQVRTLHPRLLVMGAQGQHPLRDLFVTSVTRAMLQECQIPVFIGA